MEEIKQNTTKSHFDNITPYQYNLLMAIENKGRLSECNPYKEDKSFLEDLATRLEEIDAIDGMLEIKRKLSCIN